MSIKTRITDGCGTSQEACVSKPDDADKSSLAVEVTSGKVKPKHEVTTGYYPEHTSVPSGDFSDPMMDADRSIITRSAVFTDEGSFRHVYSGDLAVAVDSALTGTMIWNGGSTIVTGTDTLFTEELKVDMYVKSTTASSTAYQQIKSINSDTELELWDAYTGASIIEGGVTSEYYKDASGTGAAITYTDPTLDLESGTANGGYALLWRDIDYLPYTLNITFSIDQRIANQTIVVGLQNTIDNVGSYAHLIFEGTDANTFVFRTGISATEYEDSTITLPSQTTADELNYEINVLANKVVLTVNRKLKAQHRIYIPGPYEVLGLFAKVENTAAVSPETVVAIRGLYNSNINVVNIAPTSVGDPIPVEVVQVQDSTDNIKGFSAGQISTAATTDVVIRQTAYTEQSSNSQRSFVSSSASDTAAGVGARSVRITYYDADGVGPKYEDIATLGVTIQDTVNTDICYVEKMEVTSVGSTAYNVGTITLYAGTGGTGGAIGTIQVQQNKTWWAHHYVPPGTTVNITSMTIGNSGDTSGKAGRYRITKQDIPTTNEPEIAVSDIVRIPGGVTAFYRSFDTPIEVEGPARINLRVVPESGSGYEHFGAFSYYEE
jgi:hypothetical protein